MRLSFLITVLLLAMTTVKGQVNDSLMIKQVRAAFKLANSSPDSALAIGIKGIQQSTQHNNKRLAANAYKTKGWALLRLGNYDSCLASLHVSTDLFRQLHDTTETVYMYLNLADVYSAHSEFTESLDYLLQADSLSKQTNDRKIQAGVAKQMGILYREQGDKKQAVRYLKESMELYRALKDTVHFCDAAGSLCITYNETSMADSSLALLKEVLLQMNRTEGFVFQKAMMHERLGDTYFALAAYPQALNDYKIAYEMFDADNNKADMAYEAINVGKIYQQLNNYNEAEKYLLLAYKINDSLAMTHYAHDAAKELYLLYKKKQDWQKAVLWMETTSALNDSLQLADQNEKLVDLQAKYETEKKDKEISLLKKDRELNQLTLQKQKTYRYGAIALFAFLILIAVLVTNRYRLVQKVKRQVEMEKLRNDIARDLHDDMGSSLSSINIISKVALENPGENPNIREQLKKIQDNSGYMLESMSDIVWAINPANDSFEKVLFKMKEFAADILEPLNIKYEFHLPGVSPVLQPDLNQRKELYLIFKEAVNNAAKHSRCTHIVISLQVDNNEIVLQVKDNGSGFDMSGAAGNGLKNIKQRAADMNGEVSIDSEKGQGTVVTLRIALSKIT